MVGTLACMPCSRHRHDGKLTHTAPQESPFRFLIRVVPSNSAGSTQRGAMTVSVEYTDVPAAAPLSFAFTFFSMSAIYVSWAAPGASLVAQLRSYQLRLSNDGVSYDDALRVAPTASVGSTTVNVTNAMVGNLGGGAGSRVWLQLLMDGLAGLSLRHAAIGPALLANSAPTPLNVRVTAVTESAVSLQWDTPLEPVLFWRVTYALLANATGSAGTNISVPGSAATVTGLATGVTYVFSVRAVSLPGEGAAVSVLGTPQSAPASPVSLVVVSEEATAVVIGWDAGVWAQQQGVAYRATYTSVNSDGHASAPLLAGDALTQTQIRIAGLTQVHSSATDRVLVLMLLRVFSFEDTVCDVAWADGQRALHVSSWGATNVKHP
jgi:hypothetical protein